MVFVGHASTIRTQRATADDGEESRKAVRREPWPPQDGTLVVLKNMPGRRHLNGRYGHIVPYLDGSMKDPVTRRARVQLCGAPYTIKVSPDNVGTCEEEPMASICWPSLHSAREGQGDAEELDFASVQISSRSDALRKLRGDAIDYAGLDSVPSTPRIRAMSPRAASGSNSTRSAPSAAPRTPKTPMTPRKCSAREGRMFGEAYAKIQASSRDPRRLRNHGISFFREHGYDWHPAGGGGHASSLDPAVTTPMGYDWRTVKAPVDYVDPSSIPHERGGFQAPRKTAEEKDEVLSSKLKELLFSGAGRVHLTSRESSAPSYFSGLSFSQPLDLNTSFLGSANYRGALEEDSQTFTLTPSQSTALPHNTSHTESFEYSP